MPELSLVCDVYTPGELVDIISKQLDVDEESAAEMVETLLSKEVKVTVGGITHIHRMFVPVRELTEVAWYAEMPYDGWLLNLRRTQWEFVDFPRLPKVWRWGTIVRWIREGYPRTLIGTIPMYQWSDSQLEGVSMAGAIIAFRQDWRGEYQRVALGRYRFGAPRLETRIGVEATFIIGEPMATWQGRLTWMGGSGSKPTRRYTSQYEITAYITGPIVSSQDAEQQLTGLFNFILSFGPSGTGASYPTLEDIVSPTEMGGWHDANFEVEKVDVDIPDGEWKFVVNGIEQYKDRVDRG